MNSQCKMLLLDIDNTILTVKSQYHAIGPNVAAALELVTCLISLPELTNCHIIVSKNLG